MQRHPKGILQQTAVGAIPTSHDSLYLRTEKSLLLNIKRRVAEFKEANEDTIPVTGHYGKDHRFKPYIVKLKYHIPKGFSYLYEYGN